MRNALVLFSLVVAVVAESPYHIPRPAPNAPVINYAPPSPVAAPLPLPAPHVIASHKSHHSSNGYNYQRPNLGPVFVQHAPVPQPIFQQQPAPLPVFQPQPQPAPLPVFQPQPQPSPSNGGPQPIQPLPSLVSHPQHVPQPLPVFHPQPAPQPQPIFHPQPIPQPQPIFHPQPAQRPQLVYQPQPAPQPLPIYQPQPQPLPIFQPQPVPQPQPVYQSPPAPQPQPIPQIPVFQPQPIPSLPSHSYGLPQAIRPLPAIIPQPQPLPQQPIQHIQHQEGYSYQQPQLPIQVSSNQNTALSSYQADTVQYNNANQEQTHRDALDETVVSRVQNIIKDNEHSSAKDAGYLSLVSGVTLENAKPSVEVLSFVHNAPLSTSSSQITQTLSASSSHDYNTSVQTGSDSLSSLAFLPQTKPATSYGVPS